MNHQQAVKLIITVILFISISFASTAQTKQILKPSWYKLDVKQSKIQWKGPKSVGNKHYGFLLLVAGIVNEGVNGKLINGDFTLDMKSIRSTDNKEAKKRKEVDDMLAGNDFFAVAKYPTAQMRVKTITAAAQKDNYKIVGDLTMKGIKKQIEFLATIRKITNNKLAIQANLTIDRHAWRIDSKEKNEANFFPDIRDKLIADEIPISLTLILNKINIE